MDTEERKNIIINAESNFIDFIDVIKKVQMFFEIGLKELQEINKETRLIKGDLNTIIQQFESNEIRLNEQFEELSNFVTLTLKEQGSLIENIFQSLEEIKKEVKSNPKQVNSQNKLPEEDIENLIREATDLLELKRYPEASIVIDKALKIAPNNSRAKNCKNAIDRGWKNAINRVSR